MLHLRWRDQLRLLSRVGQPISPRGIGTQEILDWRMQLTDSAFNILDVPNRKLNYRFMVAEWLWMSFGRSEVGSLARYNSIMRQFSDDGIFLAGAYGPHINAQRRQLVETLKADPTSRQAVIEIPRPKKPTKDNPCTLSLQFLLRNGSLNCIATMRSSDIWLGVPYDVYSFTMIQNALAGELNVNRGWFSLRAGSSHVYDRDADAVQEVLKEDTRTHFTLTSPKLPSWPPTWLEDILEFPDPELIPKGEEHEIWAPYAQVLCAPSSARARDLLKAASYQSSGHTNVAPTST